MKYFEDNDENNEYYKSEVTNGYNQNILGMTNTIDLEGSREF